MIWLATDACWVRGVDGRAGAFDETRLALTLRRAAALAGHADWWLAEAVAGAVRAAVRELCPHHTINTHELAGVVVEILRLVGYADVAEAYGRRRQYAEIRLDELVATAGGAHELGFFRELDAALQVAGDRELAVVAVRGLRSCVMRLHDARRWTDRCRRQAEEIVAHVRRRVEQSRPEGAGALRLTVAE